MYVDNGAPDLVLASFRPPLYPFFAGVIFKIFGDHPSAVVIAQHLFGVLSIVILFAAAKSLFNEAVARWAGALGTAYWVSMYWESQLYTESLFCFLFLLANYFVITAALKHGWKGVSRRAFMGGIFYGLAVLCRPAAVLALPLVVGWIVVLRAKNDRRALIPAAWILGGWILIMLPWWTRNYIVHGSFVPFVTSGGLNFWGGNHAAGAAKGIPAAWEIMKENPDGLSELEMDRWFYRDALDALIANPNRFPVALKNKILAYWWPLQRDIYQVPFRLLFPFFLIGLGASIRCFRKSSVLYLLILSQCAVSVLYNAHSRYRYSIDFYLLMIAAVGCVGLMNAAPTRRKWASPLSGLIILGLGLLFWAMERHALPLIRLWHLIPAALALVALGYLRTHHLSPCAPAVDQRVLLPDDPPA
ncbi:MAG: glycosyltransferase family 39 protein [Candidatus Eisenbacteria bacterium]|nr:glycosyltransferase family 39 protein [Candidatus Eisenbacteria bacterium]